MTLSPVAIFTFNRPEHTLNLLQSIINSKFSKKTKFYIFSDNYKKKKDKKKVKQVRSCLNLFKKKINISIIKYKKNKGLLKSIIFGINYVLKKNMKIIVLEDDLVVEPDFFTFINKSLNKYKNQKNIAQFSGYSYPLGFRSRNAYFSTLSSCWGWGIHRETWFEFINFISKKENIISEYKKINQSKRIKCDFNMNKSFNYLRILKKQINSSISSWGILFYLFCFVKKKLILYPPYSLVQNLGFDGSGNHKSLSNFFNQKNTFNEKYNIKYPKKIVINKFNSSKIQFFFQNKLSFYSKVKNLINNYL